MKYNPAKEAAKAANLEKVNARLKELGYPIYASLFNSLQNHDIYGIVQVPRYQKHDLYQLVNFLSYNSFCNDVDGHPGNQKAPIGRCDMDAAWSHVLPVWWDSN
jgi:hypothetical protein